MTEKLMFSAEEAAAKLSLGRSTIFEAMRRGDLRSVKVGRARRVAAADLAEFVEKLRAEAAANAAD